MPQFGRAASLRLRRLREDAKSSRPCSRNGQEDEKRFSREMLLLKSITMAVAVLGLLLPNFCAGQPLTPVEALDRYLASRGQPPACSDPVFNVQIDASMPTLRKQGSMSGLKQVSYTGQVVYRGLRFTGDRLVKTAVIARFLAHDTNPAERTGDVAVSRQNYWFTYNKRSDYNGLSAYVFLLKPRRKRAGLFRGELWLNAETGVPLRLWGDLVKSPSIFIGSFRFVQDYQTVGGCSQPLRLLLTAHTRIAGIAEMVIWLHPVEVVPSLEDGGQPQDADSEQ